MKKILFTMAVVAATAMAIQSGAFAQDAEIQANQPVIDFATEAANSDPAMHVRKSDALHSKKAKKSKRAAFKKHHGKKYATKRMMGKKHAKRVAPAGHLAMEAMEGNTPNFSNAAPKRAIYFPGQHGEREQRRSYAYWASQGVYFSRLQLGLGTNHRGNNVN
jgi:hypothetical protein